MRNESSHGAASRVRVAEHLQASPERWDVGLRSYVPRDSDRTQHTKKLLARSDRAALKETRALLAQRDIGDRVVAVPQSLDAFAQLVYFPWLDGLAASGRRSERGVDLYRDRWRLHISPALGHRKIGDVEPDHVAEVIHSMRRRRYAESTIASVLLILRAVYRLAGRRGLISRSPLDGLDPAKLPDLVLEDTAGFLMSKSWRRWPSTPTRSTSRSWPSSPTPASG